MGPKKRPPTDEDEEVITPLRLSKRRRQGADLSDILNGFADSLKELKCEEEDRFYLDPFMRLPKKRFMGDYFEVVKEPIDFSRIQLKVRNDEYASIDDFVADFQLLVDNAKLYYKKDSQEYADAVELWNHLEELRKEERGGSVVPSEGDADESLEVDPMGDQMAEMFSIVVKATDEGREVTDVFKILPSKRDYPDYYQVISQPIDLKTIAQNIQEGTYQSLHDLEKDLTLMCRNAKTYNEPGSDIYKDAAFLQKLIKSTRFEVENRRAPAVFKRGRRSVIKAAHSLVESIASLEDSDADDEDVDEEQELDDDDEVEEEDADNVEVEVKVPKRRGRKPKALKMTEEEEAGEEEEDEDEDEDDDDDDDDDDAEEEEEEGSEKEPEIDKSVIWDLILTIRMWQSSNQSASTPLISDQFMRIPSKKAAPDYHQEISKPMSFRKVATNITKQKYNYVKEVIADLDLIFKNAKVYNRPDSKISQDASSLLKALHARVRELQETVPNFLKLKVPGVTDADIEKSDLVLKGCRKLRPDKTENPLKARCHALYKSVLTYEEDGRTLIDPFLKKPDPEQYPDYYDVIQTPIDMQVVHERIRHLRYATPEACVADLRLMFENCRTYNEENSQIYQDANTLEKVLQQKLKDLGPYTTPPDSPVPTTPRKSGGKKVSRTKLQTLYDKVSNYVDNKGRNISRIFNKLPSKLEYPEYYDVIKEPIDLEMVKQKWGRGSYESLDDMLHDLLLMFDNACTYNEPDSQLYKDALLLRKVALQTKLELGAADLEDGVPDMSGIVLELLSNLFTSTYNHQDEKTGRCYTDSLVEFSETAEFVAAAEDEGARVLNLDLIKRAMDRGNYRRLDVFQQDMFTFFRRARKATKIDSTVWKDSIILQTFFIHYRDELCQNRFESPALSYTENDLADEIDKTKAEKTVQEASDQETPKEITKSAAADDGVQQMDVNGMTVRVGDYVYVQPREKGMEPHVTMIERLYTDEKGLHWLFGTWFYRPHETFHLASRKFLAKEVFKSDSHTNTLLNEVMGRCHVMFARDFFTTRPVGFADQDVFVCESRYFPKMKRFQKIKVWPLNDEIKYVPREKPLEAIRVPSIFRKKDSDDEKTQDGKDGLKRESDDDSKELIMPALPLQDDYRPCDRVMPDVMLPTPSGDDNENTYYEQITFSGGTYRTGDCVYVRTETDNLMARIEKMWTDNMGVGFFHGPWFVTPKEIHASGAAPGRQFFRQEVFLSSIEDTNPLLAITGRCHVMDLEEYMSNRPTEIPEEDIYVCENAYNEGDKVITRLEHGLRKILHSDAVLVDEVYTLRRPPRLARESFPFVPKTSQQEPVTSAPPKPTPSAVPVPPNASNPASTRAPPPGLISDNEDSNDLSVRDETSNHSTSQMSMSTSASQPQAATPLSTKQKLVSKVKQMRISGYIVYSTERRKEITVENPDRSFGELSRMLGNEWKELPPETKALYEEKAAKQNEINKIKHAEMFNVNNSIAYTERTAADLLKVFECHWDNCDYQFEDQDDLTYHLTHDPSGHIYQTFIKLNESVNFQCRWLMCGRVKKSQPPFNTIPKLLKHVKDVHVKTSQRTILPEQKTRNFCTRRLQHQQNATPGGPMHPGVHPGSHPGLPGQMVHISVQGHHPGQIMSQQQIHMTAPPGPSMSVSPVAAARPVVAEPLFVAPPPKPHKLLHTFAYIKYIEGLNQEGQKTVSNWDQQLKATRDNTSPPASHNGPQQLPMHWLANGAGLHGSAVNALWALRDFMLKDALNINHID
ncbi:protein polybromo-1-like isoform X2 [Varroa jacobsoni]|uniref:protein polybromo-1-like isoform X2 n=1 Tax=Varroa jacobsoni TaxID=62625 RepID=UPI000BF86909|nr:protein polybromo-1-like isoform X2 [Varroa jacobsoni]